MNKANDIIKEEFDKILRKIIRNCKGWWIWGPDRDDEVHGTFEFCEGYKIGVRFERYWESVQFHSIALVPKIARNNLSIDNYIFKLFDEFVREAKKIGFLSKSSLSYRSLGGSYPVGVDSDCFNVEKGFDKLFEFFKKSYPLLLSLKDKADKYINSDKEEYTESRNLKMNNRTTTYSKILKESGRSLNKELTIQDLADILQRHIDRDGGDMKVYIGLDYLEGDAPLLEKQVYVAQDKFIIDVYDFIH